MRRLLTVVLAAFSGCSALAGCLYQAGCRSDSAVVAALGTPCSALPITERAPLEIDGPTQAIAAVPPSGQDKRIYRALTSLECQCLAVRNAELANLLDVERQGIAEQAAHTTGLRAHTGHELSDFKQTI